MKKTFISATLFGVAFATALAQGAETAKTFNILLPSESEWQTDVPTLSYTENGEKKTVIMSPVAGKCGWFQTTFNTAPKDAIIGLRHNPELQLGLYGFWDEDDRANPMDLSVVYDAYAVNSLYFIPDDSEWLNNESHGWYTTYPEVEGICTFNLATLIYDTDQSINTLFSFDETSELDSCVGLHTGIVNTDLGTDNKPVFSGSDTAKKCFVDANKFKTLFNYTKDVNEAQCYDMLFQRNETDARWTFDSNPLGGFFPVENTGDSTVVTINEVKMGPTSDARTKRATGTAEDTRNQQFCAESHTTFTYFKDLEFSFSNTDDMWVFVNKKLAIDKGGLNESAPVNLTLKDLNSIYGDNFLVEGRDYPLEVFYCNRRSTAPNFSFAANVFLPSSFGLDIKTQPLNNEGNQLDICYEYTPASNCEQTFGTATIKGCLKDSLITDTKFTITTRENGIPEGCDICKNLPQGQISFGGIDLTNPSVPVIYPQRITGLAPGTYRLNVEIRGKRAYYRFRIQGETEVIRTSVAKLAHSGFNIKMANPHQFSIVTGNSNIAKTYAVMDMQGRIVNKGVINSTETLVPALIPGSYVVKIGVDYKRVNIR
ncbi:MAG: fibro-slime domain-containing protein [Fibrobacter sp.]|uniref:fibro-slime domain-containing protein n=1 Tax=Fibrobacter sp. TaxID=35828 RepID=UPI0025B820D1|nr:fibro-slime domain-containing protein [Fibrobacter sp.]MBR4784951.1 fibro-slime domain-containing protein [Fibrobacter sp.]